MELLHEKMQYLLLLYRCRYPQILCASESCKLMMLLVFISLGGAAHQHGKEDAPVPAQVREAHGI